MASEPMAHLPACHTYVFAQVATEVCYCDEGKPRMSEPKKNRLTWLTVEQSYRLNAAMMKISDVFVGHPYLVGSVLERADFHDVDVRMMLDDETFDRMFADTDVLLLTNAMYSHSFSVTTGLPIDFQFQRTSDANAEFTGKPGEPGTYRHALGMRLYKETD